MAFSIWALGLTVARIATAKIPIRATNTNSSGMEINNLTHRGHLVQNHIKIKPIGKTKSKQRTVTMVRVSLDAPDWAGVIGEAGTGADVWGVDFSITGVSYNKF